LDNLRKIDNSNFNITKQLSSANYHSTIGSSSNHIFYPDKEHHNFYWEAPSNISHLYLFDNRNANITIAQANGILDFSQLNCTLDDIPFIENKKGEIKINKNGLNVTLLPDYKDVTVTFDGQEYYKLQDGELERDYCSHSLKIDGRFSVNGTDLLNHHNCFTFDSEKVLFLKLNNNLLLLSDKGALSISDYYSSVHKNWDLSIGLNNRIMEPEEFGERADSFSSFRYYQPGEQGLQIYHNQPINKNDIGLVDLKGKSILDFDMKVMNDTLLLSHKNNTLVKVENWNTYQPAREMIFAFNDTVVSNAKCIASTCNSEDVVLSFNKEKVILLKEQVFNAIVRDNIDEAKGLIRKIESLNTDGKHELTPLSLAIKEGRLDIVHILFDQQHFTLGDIDIDGCTPLSLAAQEGSLSIAEFFLNEGGYIFNGENPCGTPVRIAARNGNIQMLELLFNKDLNIQIQLSTLSGMIWLIQNIEEEFSNQTDISSNAKIWIKSFIEKLKDSMKGLAKRKLEQDMLDGCSYLSSNLSSEIDKFDKELLNEIITNVIEDMYGRVDMKKMLNCVYSYGSSDQSILGPMAVFDTMKTRGDLNNAVFKLAHWIKEEMDFYKYNSASTKEESDLEMLKNQLPESVRNVVFALQVCIRNVEYGRYLYSPNDDCMYHLNSCDTNRRYAFTWPSNGGGNNFKWKVELNGDNVYLKNVEYGRYLYSPNDDCMYHLNSCDTDRRYVFTWKSREGVTNDGVWRIEDCSSTRKRRDIELEDRIGSDSSSFEDVGSEDFDEVQNLTVYKNSMRTLPDITRGKGHVKYLEEKFEEENREHHRHNHLSHKPPAIDSSNQPEIAASSGTRASSWVNDLFGWVKSSIGGLLSSKPVGISSTKDSISQVDGQFAKASVSNSSSTSTTLSSDGTDKKQESNYFTSGGFSRDNIDYVNANIKQMRERQTPVKFKPSGGNTILEMGDHYLSQVDFNGTITLFDLLIRRVTGQKYISTIDQSISPLEAQEYTLNITKGFEKVVEQAGLKSGVSMHRLNIDYMGMQKEITRKVMSGKFNEISGVLSSYIEKACPSREAGKLSPKKFDKFMIEFNKGLDITLNQSIQQILNNRNSTLEVNDVKEQQISLEPQSYLSNASVQGHLTRNKVKLIS
ncbi:MAG: ankyrin repeat domain-containing protein, partial [Wolbachia sp.]